MPPGFWQLTIVGGPVGVGVGFPPLEVAPAYSGSVMKNCCSVVSVKPCWAGTPGVVWVYVHVGAPLPIVTCPPSPVQ